MKEHTYCVGGFTFAVCLPDKVDAWSMLPSFRPFRIESSASRSLLFRLTTHPVACLPSAPQQEDLLEASYSDMGFTSLYRMPEGYAVRLTHSSHGPEHFLFMRGDFAATTAYIDWDAPHSGSVLTSLLRIVYAQTVLLHDAVSIHASTVSWNGKAYLFLGKSGTGKSTHSALWLKHIPGSELLNDDNPTLRLTEAGVVAYGTPWSGKTPCYRNAAFPVGGMVRLSQAAANRFTRVDGVEAFVTIYPGCSIIMHDATLRSHLFDTLTRMAETVPTGRLECLPDAEAARLCHAELTKTNIK